jgi:hypothetical protein
MLFPIPNKEVDGIIAEYTEYAPITRIYKVTVGRLGRFKGVQIEVFGQEIYSDVDID